MLICLLLLTGLASAVSLHSRTEYEVVDTAVPKGFTGVIGAVLRPILCNSSSVRYRSRSGSGKLFLCRDSTRQDALQFSPPFAPAPVAHAPHAPFAAPGFGFL